MKRWMGTILLLVLLQGWGTLAEPASAAEKSDKKKKEVYAAMAVGGRAGGSTLGLTLYINDYTTDEEAKGLAQTLKTGGPDALLKQVEKLNKGRLAVVGRTGNTVGIIRSRPAGKKRRIIMVTDRPLAFMELHQGTRSSDYRFGVIELLLDEKGKGEGVALLAAKIKFTGGNNIEIEHFGIDPVRLVNVYKF